ncbi:hypothetical protein G6F62_013411 [Rhizopus arrhizus]|nr:hypothetical protein G6F62_013411 [Rhizopus arrhizus]
MVAPPAPWRPPAVAAAGLGAAGAGVLQCQPGQARGLSAADAAGHGAGRRTAAAGPAAPAVRAPLPVRLQRGADAGHWRARRDADDRTPVGGGAAGAPGHACHPAAGARRRSADLRHRPGHVDRMAAGTARCDTGAADPRHAVDAVRTGADSGAGSLCLGLGADAPGWPSNRRSEERGVG